MTMTGRSESEIRSRRCGTGSPPPGSRMPCPRRGSRTARRPAPPRRCPGCRIDRAEGPGVLQQDAAGVWRTPKSPSAACVREKRVAVMNRSRSARIPFNPDPRGGWPSTYLGRRSGYRSGSQPDRDDRRGGTAGPRGCDASFPPRSRCRPTPSRRAKEANGVGGGRSVTRRPQARSCGSAVTPGRGIDRR